MEMCYNGALIMPESCIVMNKEEMVEVEGGKFSKATAETYAYMAVAAVIKEVFKVAVKNSLIGAAIKAAGSWATYAVNSVILTCMVSPSKAAAIAYGVVALGSVATSAYYAGKKHRLW